MAKITTVRRDEVTHTKVADLYGPSPQDRASAVKIPQAEMDHQSVGYYFPGSETELQLFEVGCDPDTKFHPHAHDEDEIIYVIQGELHLGRQVYGSGSAVYVPGSTLYSFSAGPDGLRFLNFRPRHDSTYITSEELRASRKDNE
jgi:quercetin dioxygenase-like cupin family protein